MEHCFGIVSMGSHHCMPVVAQLGSNSTAATEEDEDSSPFLDSGDDSRLAFRGIKPFDGASLADVQ